MYKPQGGPSGGAGGNRVTTWAFSKRICVTTVGRPKWGCGGNLVTSWAFSRRICVNTAVRVNKVQGTKAGKGGPLYNLDVFQEDLCKQRGASQKGAGN